LGGAGKNSGSGSLGKRLARVREKEGQTVHVKKVKKRRCPRSKIPLDPARPSGTKIAIRPPAKKRNLPAPLKREGRKKDVKPGSIVTFLPGER